MIHARHTSCALRPRLGAAWIHCWIFLKKGIICTLHIVLVKISLCRYSHLSKKSMISWLSRQLTPWPPLQMGHTPPVCVCAPPLQTNQNSEWPNFSDQDQESDPTELSPAPAQPSPAQLCSLHWDNFMNIELSPTLHLWPHFTAETNYNPSKAVCSRAGNEPSRSFHIARKLALLA